MRKNHSMMERGKKMMLSGNGRVKPEKNWNEKPKKATESAHARQKQQHQGQASPLDLTTRTPLAPNETDQTHATHAHALSDAMLSPRCSARRHACAHIR